MAIKRQLEGPCTAIGQYQAARLALVKVIVSTSFRLFVSTVYLVVQRIRSFICALKVESKIFELQNWKQYAD